MRPTMAMAVRRVFASCSAIVPFSPARISELPPTATRAVLDIDASPFRLPHQFQHCVAHRKSRCRLCTLASHQLQHDGLLRVQTIFGLLKNERPWRVDHLVSYLVAAMRRQAVQEDGFRLGTTEELGVDLEWEEDFPPLRSFCLLSHAGPHVGVHHVRAGAS